MRRILWWGLGILGVLVLLGALGVWVLLDSVSCTNSDPDGQRLLESQAIEDFRPTAAQLAYEPSGPACAAMFAGPSVLEPERSWFFDVASGSTALAVAQELVEAAEEDSWNEISEDVPEESITDKPAGSTGLAGSGSGGQSDGVTRELTKRVDDRLLHLRVHAFPSSDETSSSDDAWTVYVETTVGDG